MASLQDMILVRRELLAEVREVVTQLKELLGSHLKEDVEQKRNLFMKKEDLEKQIEVLDGKMDRRIRQQQKKLDGQLGKYDWLKSS